MRAILLLIKLTLCTNLLSATENVSDLPERVLYKCCPFNKIVSGGNKTCVDYNKTITYTSIKIYDENFAETEKLIKNEFKLIEARFDDEEIRNQTDDISQLPGVQLRLTQEGDLFLENPNTYDRWTLISSSGNFCVDYSQDGQDEKLHIWAITTSKAEAQNNSFITVATFISCFFLFLVLIVYYLLPELLNLHGMILISCVASLLMAFLLLAVMQINTQYPTTACIFITTAFYFFILASFCWMNVMSYDIWCTFRSKTNSYATNRSQRRRDHKAKFRMYCLYAWGVPLAMSIMLVVLNQIDMTHLPWFVTPNIGRMGCFIEDGQLLLYLYCPMMILIIGNWMFYLMTALNIWLWSRSSAILNHSSAGASQGQLTDKDRFMVYLKLSIVMGLNWVLEIISFVYPDFKGWIVTDLYNILIGFAIFLIFVCKKKIYRMLCNRYFRCLSRNYSSSAMDSSQETASSNLTVCCHNQK